MSPVVSAEIVAGALILLARPGADLHLRPPAAARLRSAAHALRAPAPRSVPVPPGAAAFSGSTLEWFTLIGPSPAPRPHLGAAAARPRPAQVAGDRIAGLPEAVTVDCHYGTDTFALALAPSAYTAMRSWLESSPPGFNVNVA